MYALAQWSFGDVAQKVLHAHLTDVDDDHCVDGGETGTSEHQSDTYEPGLAPVLRARYGRTDHKGGGTRNDHNNGQHQDLHDDLLLIVGSLFPDEGLRFPTK